MNIKDLKELIKDLPDDMRVIEAYDGPMNYGITDVVFSIEEIYQWEEFVPGFRDIRPDSFRTQEWISPTPKDREVECLGKALCIKTS